MTSIEREAYERRIKSLEMQLWIARHLAAVARGNQRRLESLLARKAERYGANERISRN